uniref:Uncharacterized protein n=1 Tax=Triticum urartu TaxID=4572 RepID=A0A8R7RB51_TRIUA
MQPHSGREHSHSYLQLHLRIQIELLSVFVNYLLAPLIISSESLPNAEYEDPPSATAVLHALFISMAFSLTFLPSSESPSMSALTARSSSAASTQLLLFRSTSMARATPMYSTSVNAFRCCSA